VVVEMGGGMGDLAVLLRTIDFAAQVRKPGFASCSRGSGLSWLTVETLVPAPEGPGPDAIVRGDLVKFGQC